jgi:predicted DNA-binding transcriptional regulator YafY
MSFEEQTARIERLIGLINSSNTGTAGELAKKMGVSRRTIFNDLGFLKGKGYPIDYCHVGNSYIFIRKAK